MVKVLLKMDVLLLYVIIRIEQTQIYQKLQIYYLIKALIKIQTLQIKCSKPLQLSTYSQKWANQLKKDVDKNNNGNCILGPKLIRHNPGVNSKKYGENIAYDSPDKGV